jgi:hypothetical protein
MKIFIWFDRIHVQDDDGRGILMSPACDKKSEEMTEQEIENFLFRFGKAIKQKKVKVNM